MELVVLGSAVAARRLGFEQLAVGFLLGYVRRLGAPPAHAALPCNDKGEFMAPTNFSRWWRTFAKENGFEGLRFHELRHTQATQLVSNGVDMKTIQHRLGHSSATLTMNLYAHALPENDIQAAQLIGNLFSMPADGEQAEQEPLRKAV